MKKTIKYLDNDGNYQYATVKDAGDLDKLKTKAKEDLVSAINELATNGIAASDIDEINNKVDQIQQQANQNADALNMSDQERQEMQQQIAQMQAEVQARVAEMQAEAQAKIAELQKLAEEQDKKLQEASAELKKKADAIDVQKMQQDNAEALKNSAKALEDSLAATNEDLQKTADHLNEMEIQAGVVETSVKELQNGFESKVSSADFNEARTKLQEQETMVRQLNNELSTKASNNELDMVTQRVQKAESNIQQNAQGIKASVTKETMYKEMDDFAKYRENRLKYSRDFSNDWSLNGNDVVDDDHLFDTQHDVKSVSIRNGAYLTQTTDLDTDDMSKTFTLAMWVEKGKRPRAWYGSAELTNMKVKEDKGDYQRVYWTFVPTIVKQDIRITGDTSTQGNLIISEPKLEQSDRPSAWSTNTGDQYATTEKLAHDLKLTADKLESTITKQSEFSDRQQQDESRITQTEHGVEVANQTIVAKTDGLRQEFDGKISATSKSLTSEYQSFTNQAIGQMADGGSNLILNSSFGSLKNSYDKWTNVSPKVRIVEDDNGLKWAKMEQSGLTADSPIGLTSNLFRVKKGIVTVALDIRTDNAQSIDNDNIVILESYNADQKRVFTKEIGFGDLKIARETLFDHGPHRVTYKYNQTRDDTQYMAVHIVLPKNGVLYVTNVLARTVANGEDSGEYAPNAADLHEQVVQQRTRIEQNDQAIALKADQTKVTQDIDAAKSSLSGAISKVEQRAANLEVKADGITSSVSTLSKTIDGISVGGTNLLLNTKDFTGDWYQQGSASLQDLDGRKVIHAWADWSSYRTRQVIQLEQNTDYTISADIRSLDGNSSDNTVTIHGVLDGKDTQLGDLHTNGKLSSKQQRFSTVWHNTSAGQLTTFRLEGHGGWGSVHDSIYISHIKLEKGNKPTDWSPAPEDTDANISSLQSRASKLEQTDSEIKASVTSVTNDLKNGRGTIKEGVLSMTDDHFSTKFSSIDNRINGISVGGTNYMSHDLVSAANSTLTYNANSGEWTAQIANGAGGTWGGGVQFNKSLMQVPWDQAYTDSIEVYVTDPGLEWMMDINNFGVVNDSNLGGNDNDDRSLAIYRPAPNAIIPTNQWYKVSFTAWNKDSKNKNQTALWDQSRLLLVNNTGKTVTVKFRHPQQELGSTATDWSPASGDATSSGINILRNTTYPGGFVTFPAEWDAGQWRQASNGGSKKERWDYNGSPIGNVKGYRVESGSESRDVTVAQDNVVISANTEYTMSVFARGSGQLFMQMGFDQTWLSNSQTLSTDWTRYKFTFNSYDLTKANAYFGLKSANSWVDLIGFKLEQGNVATAWSPSPWDAQARVDGVVSKQAEFQTSIDGVKSTVSTLNNNNQARFTKLEQTDGEIKASVTSVTNSLKNGRGSIKEGVLSMTDDHFSTKFSSIDNKIDGISVGGTNLVTGTSDDLENKTSSGWYYLMSEADNANFDLANYKGQVITIRAWIEKPSVDSRLQMWTNNGFADGTVVKAGQSGYSTITGWTVPDTFSSWHLVYGNGGAITFGIKKLKIEHGNKPTDWSPQVSDLKLGGDNLLPNSGKMYVLSCYSANSMTTRTTTTGERYDGENYKRITGEVLPKNDIFIALGKTGETYTQSIEVETDGFPKDSIVVSWFANNNVGHQYRPIHIDKLGKNTYRLWSTYSQTQDDLSIRVIDFSNFQLVGGSYIEFRHPKLERGNRPTAWTPSIDDQNGTGANILKNSSTPHVSAASSKWEDGGWRGAGHGGSKKEVREYSDSILGHVYGLHIESGDDSTDVDYAQDGVPFKIGQVYTISAYACGSGTVFLEAGPGANGVWHMYTEKVGASWKKFSYSFIADADHMNVYFGAKEANSVIDIIGMKLECGAQSTTYNTGGWEVSVNGLKSEFARLDGNTLKYSSMEQTADGFKFTVGSGNNQKTIDLNTNDNLLIGTSSNWRRIYNYGDKGAWREYFSSNSLTTPIGNFANGQSFAYSLDFKNTSDHDIAVETYWRDVNGARIFDARPAPNSSPFAPNSNVSVHYEMVTQGKPANAYYLEAHVISTNANTSGPGSYIYIRNEKLEANDHATPWCVSSGDKSGNLLTGSTTYNGWIAYDDNSVKNNGVNVDWKDNNGNPSRKQSTAWHGYTEKIWLNNGTYTFSGQVYIVGDAPVWVYTSHPREGAFGDSAMIDQQTMQLPATRDRWQTFVFPFEVSYPGYVFPRVESSNDNTVVHIGSFKVERGLHTTAQWSEHPQTAENKTTNLQTGLSAAQATIEQNSKSIALKVDTGKIINTINNSTEGIHISGNKIDIQSLKSAINLDNGNVKINGDRISLTTNNAKTLASQINADNSGITISGKHISINGDTSISGQLKIGSVPLVNGSRKISLDTNNGIFIGDSKNSVSINNGVVGIAYNEGAAMAAFTGFGVEFGANTNGRKEILGALGVTYLEKDTNINGLGIIMEPQQILGDPFGGDIFTISARNGNGTMRNDMIYDAIGNSGIKGFTFYENVRVYPPGAATGITTGWIQYGDGAKWPVLMNTPPNYGGIGFTTDGNPFLFSNKHGYMFTDGSRSGDVYSHWSP